MTDAQLRDALVSFLMSNTEGRYAWDPASILQAASHIGVTEARVQRAVDQLQGRVVQDKYTGEIDLWK